MIPTGASRSGLPPGVASPGATRLVCHACGRIPEPGDPTPFRCPGADGDDDLDHVLRRRLDPGGIPGAPALFDDPEPNPFLRYRRLLHSWQVGRSLGLGDEGFRALVERLDDSVARIEGRSRGFVETPLHRATDLAKELGLKGVQLRLKDETGNVAGSHKARHLAGLALWAAATTRPGGDDERPLLAIASCGNAALAASVVAAAAGRRLRVFVPTWAEPGVVAEMERLDAEVVSCPRRVGEVGDPCVRRLEEALAAGAVPFTCQGNRNALTIEGGQTLAWEIVSALRREGGTLDRLFVQVGGGALAAACLGALEEAVALGALARLPRVHPVQTSAIHPLALAWRRFAAHCAIPESAGDADRAAELSLLDERTLSEALRFAAVHRSRFMEPWPHEARSLATGILDDETYDWLAVLEGTVRSGGWPVVVGEQVLAEASRLACEASGSAVDPTGSAGLAGLLALSRTGAKPVDESVAVLLTGRRR